MVVDVKTVAAAALIMIYLQIVSGWDTEQRSEARVDIFPTRSIDGPLFFTFSLHILKIVYSFSRI